MLGACNIAARIFNFRQLPLSLSLSLFSIVDKRETCQGMTMCLALFASVCVPVW